MTNDSRVEFGRVGEVRQYAEHHDTEIRMFRTSCSSPRTMIQDLPPTSGSFRLGKRMAGVSLFAQNLRRPTISADAAALCAIRRKCASFNLQVREIP